MAQPSPGRPAVFMDRDGCLVEEMGYLNHPSRVRILPRPAAAVSRLNAAGIPAIVATNQAGIARGYFSAETLREVNAEVERQLRREGAHLAAAEQGLDLTRSVMVGDKPSDVAAGQAAGAAGVLVLTGYGRGEWEYLRHEWTVKPDHVAEDLFEAVEWALGRLETEKGAECSL